jgi:hypothetical protein
VRNLLAGLNKGKYFNFLNGGSTLQKNLMQAPFALILVILFSILSCTHSTRKIEGQQILNPSDEFDNQVEIKIEEGSPQNQPAEAGTKKEETVQLAPSSPGDKDPSGNTKRVKDKKGKAKDLVKSEAKVPLVAHIYPALPPKHEPDLENPNGFYGRRPIVDPFRVGERVTHSVSYFKVEAGELILEVRPFAQVNGRKSYNFATIIRSNSTFSTFYSVDDVATTHLDYESLIPSVFTLHVKESSQLREGRGLFNFQTKQATYWEKKYTEKDGHKEKKQQWDILEYSQNVYSAVFYMRLFQWEVGKENAFRVAHDEENLVFRGKAIRKERIETEVGDFNAIVVKTDIELKKGVFKPTGDIYFWLSDDDRRLVLRIESKIKIGTITTEVVKLEPGRP